MSGKPEPSKMLLGASLFAGRRLARRVKIEFELELDFSIQGVASD